MRMFCSITRRMLHNRKRLGFGGGGAGSSGSSSTSDPWGGQQPYLSDTFNQAAQLYDNYTPQYYGADNTSLNGQDISGQSTIAPMNAQENSAISDIGDTGLNGNSSFNAANTAMTNQLSGNPAMNQSIAAGVVPGLESQFAQGNAMNSPAAAYSVSNGLGNALLQNQQGAASQASALYNSQLGGQNAALTAGQTAQTQSQNELQNNVNMFNYQQQLPYTQLNNYANLVNGQYGSTTSTVSPAGGFFTSLFS